MAETTSEMETVPKRVKKEESDNDGDSRKRMMVRKEYSEFEEKVRRTVFVDNLSPQVTAVVIKMALGQFGNVANVEFIPNFTIPFNIPQCALVEMETEKQARHVIESMSSYPFLISGMPRPVRARSSKAEMFADRPSPPDRKIVVRWLEQSDPNYDSVKKLKELVKEHRGETFALIELLRKEEEKLARQQSELLQANYKKYEMIDNLVQDGAFPRLARHYGIKFALVDE